MNGTTYNGSVNGHDVFSQSSGHGSIINNFHERQVTSPVHHYIPLFRNNNFVLRPELVKRLDDLLSPLGRGQRVALYGLGGSGKTSLALQFAYAKSEDQTAPCSVFWVHAESRDTFTQGYLEIGQYLGIPVIENGNRMLEAIKIAIMREPLWLLIIDNADDLELFGFGALAENNGNVNGADAGVAATRKSLRHYIPSGPHGSILYTTRDGTILNTLADGHRGIEVARMMEAEAIELFTKILGPNKIIQETEKATRDELLEELEWLPLAVSQAAFHIRRTSTSIDDYLKQLKHDGQRWAVLSNSAEDINRPEGATNSVLATWDVSVKRIEKDDWLAHDLLHLVAFFDNQNIPETLLVESAAWLIESQGQNQGTNDDAKKAQVTRAINRLVDFSFLTKRKSDDDEPSYEMHKLVQEGVRYMLNQRSKKSATFGGRPEKTGRREIAEAESRSQSSLKNSKTSASTSARQKREGLNKGKKQKSKKEESKKEEMSQDEDKNGEWYARGALSIIERVFPHVDDVWRLENWRVCEKYLAHAMRISDSSDTIKQSLRGGDLLQQVSRYLFFHGRDMDAAMVSAKSIKLLQSVLGDSHQDLVKPMSRQALILKNLRHYAGAEAAAKQALKIAKGTLGEHHWNTFEAMNVLASVYFHQGDIDRAELLAVPSWQESKKRCRGTRIQVLLPIPSIFKSRWQCCTSAMAGREKQWSYACVHANSRGGCMAKTTITL
jgi:GTPase SAR1 family protein